MKLQARGSVETEGSPSQSSQTADRQRQRQPTDFSLVPVWTGPLSEKEFSVVVPSPNLSIDASSSWTELDDLSVDDGREGDVLGKRTPLNSAPRRTGLVHHVGENHVDRNNQFQRERPDRITGILKALQPDLLPQCYIYTPMPVLAPSSLSSFSNLLFEEDFLRVHLFGYLQRINRYATCTCEHLEFEAEQYDSIFLSHQSALEAKQAAASLCSLVSRIVQGELHNGFAIIRPPGHHAEPGMARGYCLINNIAVAAQFARFKLGVGKVLIVDWDIHHGNGTQKIFWQDPNVLYFSVHRGGHFYPFSTAGRSTMVGDGDGRGYNVNVSWTAKGMGDDEYWAVWQTLLLPMLREYSPDLILVSAGFDGADGDMGECHVTPAGFGRLTSSLVATGVPVVCALEGGYVPSVLQACVRVVIQALLDPGVCENLPTEDTDVESHLNSIHRTAARMIRDTRLAHAPFWKFLRV